MALDLPLERIHRLAFKAAEAAHCAGDQGHYWEMHDRLFANQRALEPWSGHAAALGLDVAEFDSCMASDRHAAYPERDPVTPEDVAATIYHALGLEPETEIRDHFDRPLAIALGNPIESVLV